MRIFLRRKEQPRDMYVSMRERLHSELADGESELRKLFARVARSESRDFFALHIGTELEKFERELQARSARALAELGSAAWATDPDTGAKYPSSTAPASGQLEREVRRALTVLERDHRKLLYTLPPEKVCWNSACSTQEPVPHMLDERDHRTIGDVEAEKRGLCNDKGPFSPLPCGRPTGHSGRHKRGEREWDSRTLPTCAPDNPCNLPGHGGTVDPLLSMNMLDVCPHATFTIPNKENL